MSRRSISRYVPGTNELGKREAIGTSRPSHISELITFFTKSSVIRVLLEFTMLPSEPAPASENKSEVPEENCAAGLKHAVVYYCTSISILQKGA